MEESVNSVHDFLLAPDAQQEYSFREEKGVPVSGTARAKQTHVALQAAKECSWGFPGGAVVKNLPASAGDTGSSPGPRTSHMPRSN